MADEVDAAMLALVAAAAATAHRADRGAQTSAPHSPAASLPPPRAASQEEVDLRSQVSQEEVDLRSQVNQLASKVRPSPTTVSIQANQQLAGCPASPSAPLT
jgi:hypothetical protein